MNRPAARRSIAAKTAGVLACALTLLSICACTFDYGFSDGLNVNNEPDLVMRDVEYVRMVNAQPLVRLRADEVRRYEASHTMELDNFSFEQFNAAPSGGGQTPEVNVLGGGGSAKVQTDTGNLVLNNVYVDVKSEEISLNTRYLAWDDKQRLLTAPGDVNITRPNGTKISGRGLSADIRRRSWQFDANVRGDIVEDNDPAKREANAEEALLETILETEGEPEPDTEPVQDD
jgi:LPS export ABC transporter protein LptC